MKNNLILYFFYFSFSIFIIFSSFFFFIFYEANNLFLTDDEVLSLKKSYVYGHKNELLFDFYNKKIDKIFFNEIPNHCVYAFISKEDANFFNHRGLSLTSMIRALWVNLKAFKFVQGGSTITQQLVKLKRGNLKKTWSRKILEQIMALVVESNFSKEEIFQEYLRVLYFGNGIFGITDAANKFWNKKPSELTILESATLAGIIQSPENFNPEKNYANCLKKRNFVLKRIFNEGYIKKEDYENLINEPLILSFFSEDYDNDQILITLKSFFEKDFKNICENESMFYTTFDKDLQKTLSRIFYKNINELRKKEKNIEGGCVLFDFEKNEVRAIVQGFDNKKSNFLHATKLKRQVGSLIKPLIFYYSFINGDSKNSIYDDSPLEKDFKWSPNNFNKKFLGEINLEKAFIESNNIVPIRILKKYGISNFVNFLKKFQISDEINEYYSIALGCLESTPFDFYTVLKFINDGDLVRPFFCRKVSGINGNLIYKNKEFLYREELESNKDAAFEVKEIMFKIGKRLQKVLNINLKENIFAKTGTTNGAKNCWFMGGNNKYGLIVYVGCDNQENLWKKNVTSLRSAAKIGLSVFKEIEKYEN